MLRDPSQVFWRTFGKGRDLISESLDPGYRSIDARMHGNGEGGGGVHMAGTDTPCQSGSLGLDHGTYCSATGCGHSLSGVTRTVGIRG